MKRRQLIRYSSAALLTCLGTSLLSHWEAAQAQGGPLSIQWLGHTAFLFNGGGQRILVNPFRNAGCTAKYRSPKVSADLVMISSRLLDEGSVEGLPGRPKLLYEPGTYQTSGLEIQGIATEHDRVGGYRFGTNVAWKWTQAGVKVLHLGGIAAPISLEQKILMGQPDVLLIPVGNSPKAYTPEEAKAAVQMLQPKLVIPTHYRTEAADPNACELVPVDEFLSLMQGTTIRRVGSDSLTVSAASLPAQGPVIQVLSYRF